LVFGNEKKPLLAAKIKKECSNMKGKSFFAFSLAVLLIVASSVTTYANIPVRVQLDGVFLDVDAVVVDGRTLAPARAIVEALGGVVDWDGELFQVTINHGNTRILLTIDKPTAYVNGVAVILDVPPQIVAGRTKIPVRFVSETLGLDVGFHYNNFVFLTTIPTEAPQPVIPQPNIAAYYTTTAHKYTIVV